MSIGARLEKALEMIGSQENIRLFADIGSDHANLAAEAVRRGMAAEAVASDVNRGPLERGRAAHGDLRGLSFVLSDGFDAIDGMRPDCAAICGMGGETIAEIVMRSESAKECRLILQPMTRAESLRRALWENGFTVTDEAFVAESGKVYCLICARYSGVPERFDEADLYLGKIRPNTKEFAAYAEKVMRSAEKRRKSGAADECDAVIKACQTHITYFSGT